MAVFRYLFQYLLSLEAGLAHVQGKEDIMAAGNQGLVQETGATEIEIPVIKLRL